jgi:hypothetical protein
MLLLDFIYDSKFIMLQNINLFFCPRKYKAGWSPPSATSVEPVSVLATYNYITTRILKITRHKKTLRKLILRVVSLTGTLFTIPLL